MAQFPPTIRSSVYCWLDGSSFKGFSVVFLSDWVNSNHLKSGPNADFWTFFAPYSLRRNRNNKSNKLCNTLWGKKCSRNLQQN